MLEKLWQRIAGWITEGIMPPTRRGWWFTEMRVSFGNGAETGAQVAMLFRDLALLVEALGRQLDAMQEAGVTLEEEDEPEGEEW